jgi:hypothetical protein
MCLSAILAMSVIVLVIFILLVEISLVEKLLVDSIVVCLDATPPTSTPAGQRYIYISLPSGDQDGGRFIRMIENYSQ